MLRESSQIKAGACLCGYAATRCALKALDRHRVREFCVIESLLRVASIPRHGTVYRFRSPPTQKLEKAGRSSSFARVERTPLLAPILQQANAKAFVKMRCASWGGAGVLVVHRKDLMEILKIKPKFTHWVS